MIVFVREKCNSSQKIYTDRKFNSIQLLALLTNFKYTIKYAIIIVYTTR